MRARRLGEAPSGGKMVGVNVGVDHEVDAHSHSLRGVHVRLDVPDRINDRRSRLAPAAEQIGNADGVLMEKLAQDHTDCLRSGSLVSSHSINMQNERMKASAIVRKGPKQGIFASLAEVAQALGHASRLELLEHLGKASAASKTWRHDLS